MELTQSNLKKILNYNRDTGVFVWKVRSSSRVPAGSVAGKMQSRGYSQICIKGKNYYSHRLAWLYAYGYTPENNIDHINRVKTDNRIENLREVSQRCNVRNSKQHSKNTSGVKGVYFETGKRKWVARITSNYKSLFLGRHNHKDNAICARLAAEQCLGWAGCDSNSSAYQYVRHNIQKKKVTP